MAEQQTSETLVSVRRFAKEIPRDPPGSKQRTFNDTRDSCRSQAYPVFGLPLTEYLGRTLLTSANGVERCFFAESCPARRPVARSAYGYAVVDLREVWAYGCISVEIGVRHRVVLLIPW